MVNLRIYLREYAGNFEGIVWFSFYINRKKVHFSTKVKCEKKHWDLKKMLVKSSDKDFSDKNRIIENTRARVNDVFVKYRLRNKKLTREAFLRAYNRPDDFVTFFDFIENNKKKYQLRQRTYYTLHASHGVEKSKRIRPGIAFR